MTAPNRRPHDRDTGYSRVAPRRGSASRSGLPVRITPEPRRLERPHLPSRPAGSAFDRDWPLVALALFAFGLIFLVALLVKGGPRP